MQVVLLTFENRPTLERLMADWEKWREGLKESAPPGYDPEIYGFAYWLVRYSGYTVEPPDAPDGLRHKLREARKRCRELAQAIFESFPHAHTPKIRALLRKWDDDGLG